MIFFNRFAVMSAMVLVAVATFSGCAPKDEKVSTVGGSGDRGAATNSDEIAREPNDLSADFTRAVLIETVDVVRQIETALASEADTVLLSPCKTIVKDPDAVGLKMFRILSQKCEEKGRVFNVSSLGEESYTVAGSQFEVIGKRVGARLVPLANAKDSVSVSSFRFLKAWRHTDAGDVAGATAGDESIRRTYRFKYESSGHYNLDLKAFTDSGEIQSIIVGSAVYDSNAKKVISVSTSKSFGQVELLVKSARRARKSTTASLREFRITTRPEILNFNGQTCALPVGVLETRFTIGSGPNSNGKKFLRDVESKFQSEPGELVSVAKSGEGAAPIGKVQSTICQQQQISQSEYYSGLFY